MLLSSPSFIIQSYSDWGKALLEKNAENIVTLNHSTMQDISVMGFIRRVFGIDQSINLFVLVPAFYLICFPLFRFDQFRYHLYRLTYLAVILISVVIFSTSAESSTYIIAVTGAAIWYMSYPRNRLSTALLAFMLLLTCLSPTDLFPHYIREHFIKPYSLKALPCIIIWGVLIWNLFFKNFSLSAKSFFTDEISRQSLYPVKAPSTAGEDLSLPPYGAIVGTNRKL